MNRTPKWWGRYQPPAYDPGNPYAPDPGRRQDGGLNRLGRRMAENNPEAYFGREMAMAGLPYNRQPGDFVGDFLRDQFLVAQQGYQQSRLARPNLTWVKYANNDPTIDYLMRAYGTPRPPTGHQPGRGGR